MRFNDNRALEANLTEETRASRGAPTVIVTGTFNFLFPPLALETNHLSSIRFSSSIFSS